MTIGGILGTLLLAGAILMGVFWIQTRQENAELRKRLEEDKTTENVCLEAESLKQK